MNDNNQSEVNEVKEPSEKYNGNPQIEDGFTKISNELLEALSKAMAQGIITARERAVIDWIIRYTYGFQQKNGYFHTSFIAKNLGLSMSWISQILKSLEKKKVIIRNGEEIQINKHYLEWSKYLEPSKCLEHSKQSLEHSKHYLEPSKQSEPTNSIIDNVERLPKENIYKENYIKKTDLQNVNSSSLKDEKDLKDKDIVGREAEGKGGDQEVEKKIAQIYSIFEKVMEAKYGTGYRVSYREYTEALAIGYPLDVIEKVLIELKKRIQKERPKDWRSFVNPKSLSKKIDDILAESEKQEKQEAKGYGYF